MPAPETGVRPVPSTEDVGGKGGWGRDGPMLVDVSTPVVPHREGTLT
ncbi:MAG: hypothetical protein GY696_36265 [Gammaproteobacteria bacterium]|nr:hypothetical protein [Gammaproteobacteria bacterium]